MVHAHLLYLESRVHFTVTTLLFEDLRDRARAVTGNREMSMEWDAWSSVRKVLRPKRKGTQSTTSPREVFSVVWG